MRARRGSPASLDRVISAYSDKVRFRARRQRQYEALRDVPA